MSKGRENEVALTRLLISDSRISLTEMSKQTGIPISTCWESLKRIRKEWEFTIAKYPLPEDLGLNADGSRPASAEGGTSASTDKKAKVRCSKHYVDYCNCG